MSYKKRYQQGLTNTGNYYLVPNAIYEMDLSPSQIMVFGYLFSINENFHPSMGLISKMCCLTNSTVRKALKGLEAKKMLEKFRGATKGDSAQYRVIPTSEWSKILPSRQDVTL